MKNTTNTDKKGSVTFPMKIIVKPGRKHNKFIEDKGRYVVYLKAKPEKGKANRELIKFLSKHFKKNTKITSGLKSKKKIIDIA